RLTDQTWSAWNGRPLLLGRASEVMLYVAVAVLFVELATASVDIIARLLASAPAERRSLSPVAVTAALWDVATTVHGLVAPPPDPHAHRWAAGHPRRRDPRRHGVRRRARGGHVGRRDRSPPALARRDADDCDRRQHVPHSLPQTCARRSLGTSRVPRTGHD